IGLDGYNGKIGITSRQDLIVGKHIQYVVSAPCDHYKVVVICRQCVASINDRYGYGAGGLQAATRNDITEGFDIRTDVRWVWRVSNQIIRAIAIQADQTALVSAADRGD